MKGRLIPFVAALIAALAVIAPSAAAPPAGTSIAIERQATLVTPIEIVVRVVVDCPAGTEVDVFVDVSQQQASGPNTRGSGGAFEMCTGAKQTIDVPVIGGPFVPGDAFAGGEVRNVHTFTTDQDSRVIDIS